jgi:uncharacterized membrane protein HdeD (DUF308 family)
VCQPGHRLSPIPFLRTTRYTSSRMLIRLAGLWWLVLLKGAVTMLAGVAILASAGESLWVFAILLGVAALVDGVMSVAIGVGGGWTDRPWWEMVLAGVVGILAGLATLAPAEVTALMLLAVFGCWALARGLIEIASAIALRKVIDGEWLLVMSGAVSVAFGVLLFAHPPNSTLAVATFIGAYLMTFGAVSAGLSLRLRRVSQALNA